MRGDVLVAQQYIKRFHSMVWYKRIKEGKDGLETHIEQINEMITKFNLDANLFKGKFPNKEVTSKLRILIIVIEPLEYLGNFESYEMVKAKRGMAE
jgi:hypothetical protein